METIKISVISKERSLYENIKYILKKLKIFEVDCTDNIKKCIDHYDILMIDMDSFKPQSEEGVLQLIHKLNNHKKIILLKNIDKARHIKGINILVKPITEMKLIDSICNVKLDDLSEMLNAVY